MMNETPTAAGQPTILVADDDAVFLELMSQALEGIGYRVEKAGNGVEAVRLCKTSDFDLVLMDGNMPVMDGFQACSEMKDVLNKGSLPVVMITALTDDDSVNKAFGAGAEEYVTKPINWTVLRHRVRTILQRKTMELALRQSNEEMETNVRERTKELKLTNEQLQHNIAALELSKTLMKASELKFRSLVETSPDSIIIVDEDGTILFINRSIWKLSLEEVLGTSVFDYLPDSSKPKYKTSLAKVFSSGAANSFLTEGLSSTWWQVRIVPLSGKSRTKSAMVIAADITEKQNLQVKAMQNARLATVGTLAASVAHEVNNPNNAILLQSSWLNKAWPDLMACMEDYADNFANHSIGGRPFADAMETFQEFFSGIVRNSRRIGAIAGNLKRTSKPDSGKLQENVDVNKTVQASQSMLASQIDQYCDACSFHYEKNIPLILGNSLQLEQVFTNLILNALQSLSDRKEEVWVATSFDEKRQRAVVVVRDQGVGISADNLEKVLEPFFTTKLERGGTGLGLSICHSIIKNHLGSLDIHSQPGKGTTVSVDFPQIGVAQ